MNYYNEFDPHAAKWLRNLIEAGVIAPGEVDERSIEDVTPIDLREFTQCHFFAGIGGWAYALDLAGWPRSRPVWTGSCPCQPFSSAGKGAGFEDERHLWPAWQHLIAQCRPSTIFGEQVASKAVGSWIDLVHADVEGMGYAFGSVPFPAAGVGAPHIRDRNYWMANADDQGLEGRGRVLERAGKFTVGADGLGGRLADADSRQRDGVTVLRGNEHHGEDAGRPQSFSGVAARSNDGSMADTASSGRREERTDGGRLTAGDRAQGNAAGSVPSSSDLLGLAHADSERRERWRAGEAGDESSKVERLERLCDAGTRPGPVNGQWRDSDWLGCRDGKWRPVEPGTFPLAHGLPGRVGLLRGYGNAIVPQAAAEFIAAAMQQHGEVEQRVFAA
jgi:DNA (cytosine-5)-methyltransferase 1